MYGYSCHSHVRMYSHSAERITSSTTVSLDYIWLHDYTRLYDYSLLYGNIWLYDYWEYEDKQGLEDRRIGRYGGEVARFLRNAAALVRIAR